MKVEVMGLWENDQRDAMLLAWKMEERSHKPRNVSSL